MNRFLLKVIKFMGKAKDDSYCHCAIVTDKKGKILSKGWNSYKKTHPRQAYYAEKIGNLNKIFLHAELDALIKVPENKRPYAIYIARVNKHGKPRNSKPCSLCQMAIKDAGIKEVYYT